MEAGGGERSREEIKGVTRKDGRGMRREETGGGRRERMEERRGRWEEVEWRARTYMLAVLEEKPGERAAAAKSLTEDESPSPPSGVSASGSRGPEKSAAGASVAESLLAYSSSIWVVVLLRA